MPEITAKLVNELRAKTSQPMMTCKKMLTQTGGDIDAAIAEFRKIGIKTSLAERAASEGRVGGVAAADGSAAALVELNCNTDFTAKSEPFLKLATKAAQQYLHRIGKVLHEEVNHVVIARMAIRQNDLCAAVAPHLRGRFC